MKVLHVSTYDIGGAAKAAIRLHQGLLELSIDSNFLSLYNADVDCSSKYQHQYNYGEKLLENARIKWQINYNRGDRQKINEQYRQKRLEAATLPITSFDITKQPIFQEADIINLHWISGYVNQIAFWKKNTKPVVWTLHDMNPFSGIYHYQEDAIRNNELLGELDCTVSNRKGAAYQHANISVVCPSEWLLECSKSSQLLHHFPHYHIPNSINTNVFKLQDRYNARRKLALPEDKKILLFVSQNVTNYRKGYDLLQKALSLLKKDQSLYVVAIGNMPKEKNNSIHYLGSIKDETTMARAYAAADAFVMPSREDNLPNVMLESLACGTPVIAFPIGGVLDVIEHKENGWLALRVSAEALALAIQEWSSNSKDFNHSEISHRAVKRFDLNVQATHYQKLYHKVFSTK